MKKCSLGLIVCTFFIIPFKGTAQNIDVSILQSVYKNETKFKDNFFKLDAQSVNFFNVAAPATIFVIGLKNHNKQMQRDAIYIGGAYVLASVMAQGAKRIFDRERPFVAYPQLFADRYDGGGYSFPSGHTAAAFCTATSLSLYFPKWYVIAPSYLWAASIGWARMYEGVHYPSDVLAGAIMGAASAWAGYKFEKYMNKKHPLHAKRTF